MIILIYDDMPSEETVRKRNEHTQVIQVSHLPNRPRRANCNGYLIVAAISTMRAQ